MSLDAKEAAVTAKKYFEETKTTTPYFLFETTKVMRQDGLWVVECEVRDVFEDESKKYTVMINDEDGSIVDVERSI